MRADWAEIELIKLAKFIDYRGRTPKKTNDGIPLITAKNVRMGYIKSDPKEYIAENDYEKWMTRGIPQAGDILFTTEAPMGYVAQLTTNNKIALAQRLITFQPVKEIESTFLKLNLMSPYFQTILNSQGTGTTVKGIKAAKLKLIKIRVAPLPEQRAIVAKIESLFSELDQGITDLKKAHGRLKVYRQAVLKKAFEGKLTKEWREKYNVSINEWKTPKLEEVLIQSKEKYKPDNLQNLFYIGLEHIEKETGCLTETVGFEEIKTVKNKFSKGQILYGKLRPYLNKVHLANETGVCSTDILVFDISPAIIGTFVLKFMLSRSFVNDMSANTNGVNLPRVSTKYINNYLIPLPSITEQYQIVREIESRLSVCDKVEQSIIESLEKAKALRQSILKKAFEGRLLSEVELEKSKKEPDWEPAGGLLERIKQKKK